MKRKSIKSIVYILVLAILFVTPQLYSAGTEEVTAREKQFADRYAPIDIPYTAGIRLQDSTFTHDFDFTIQTTHDYTYTESIVTSETDPAAGITRQQNDSTTAAMRFRQTGLSFADVVYTNMEIITESSLNYGSDSAKVDFSESYKPLVVTHKGFTEKGAYPYDSLLNFSYSLQFPLSQEEMKIGSTVSIPIALPILYLGGESAAFGELALTLTGYVDINGKQHAKLLADISITDDNLPDALRSSEFSFSAEGYGVYYYNIEDKSYYYGSYILETRAETAPLLPNMNKFAKAQLPAGNRVLETRTAITYWLVD